MKRTPLVVLVVLIALGLYDLGCVVFTGVGSSISQFIVNTTHVSPLVSFVFGCLAGHLFFSMEPTENKK